MLYNTGYLGAVDDEFIDDNSNICVGSCGHFKLLKLNHFQTNRPKGRKDIQLLYLAKGLATFHLQNRIYQLQEGNMFIYMPDEPQQYHYELGDHPDMYWIHFYESFPYPILEKFGLNKSGIYELSPRTEYTLLFEKIIQELQLKRTNYDSLSNLYCLELLTLFSRNMLKNNTFENVQNQLFETIIQELHKNFQSDISIKEYAQMYHMSCCWFIRSFKRYTGVTPQQYITDIRINKAKELLRTSSFNISEISTYIGYQNPLYFSRIFKKITGISPSAYKKYYYILNKEAI